MRRSARFLSLLLFGCLFTASSGTAQDRSGDVSQQIQALNWKTGSQIGRIGTEASIALSPDLGFLGSADTRRFLELNGTPPRDDHYTLAPKSLRWFSVFEFDRSGYVRDDEKIDPEQLLTSRTMTLQPSNWNGGHAFAQKITGLWSITRRAFSVAMA